jgi:hypothetical protein
MIPSTVIDNFFDDPDSIREFALKQEFTKAGGVVPGVRTRPLNELNPDMFDMFCGKLFSAFFDFNITELKWNVEATFQLTSSYYQEGWVHADSSYGDGVHMAGVVYLSPDAPVNAGTSIWRQVETPNWNDDLKAKFYSDQQVDMKEYISARDKHNSHFEKTLDVGNVYNRLATYSSTEWHKENMFFGEGKQSRLTLVFFASVNPVNSMMPIDRVKNIRKL